MALRAITSKLPIARCANIVSVRNSSLWQPRRHPSWPLASLIDHDINRIGRLMDRLWRTSFFPPSRFDRDFHELDGIDNLRTEYPIIEEDGVKKFKLVFDVSHFRAEDINIKTSTAKNLLTIEAKHQTEAKKGGNGASSLYEYRHEMALPEGVRLEEMRCHYTPAGELVVEAPYIEPPPKEGDAKKVEAPKTPQEIPIKKE